MEASRLRSASVPPTGPHSLFLDRLDEATRQKFIARAVRRRFNEDSLVVHEGEPGSGLFVTVAGLVKVFKNSANGREQVLRYAPPGSSFNAVTVLDQGPKPPSARTVVDSRSEAHTSELQTQMQH